MEELRRRKAAVERMQMGFAHHRLSQTLTAQDIFCRVIFLNSW